MSDKFWPAFKEAIKEWLFGRNQMEAWRMEKEYRANAELAEYQHKQMMKDLERKIRMGR